NPADHYIYKYIKIESASISPTEFSVTYADGIVTVCSSKARTFRLIFAAYSGTELHSLKTVSIAFTAPGKLTHPVPADFNTAGATDLKIMLWESAETMKPLCEIK
ncbi:MAG: hypothetical protein Q4C12_06905, partial [Clostridia bacterium]|nr:hypothetical protein [Clostridia bacterium]